MVKPRLSTAFGISDVTFGHIETFYTAAYAIGQFINGALGDRFGARRMIGVGMLASAGAACAFGSGSTALLFLLAYGLNGFFQSTGWPNNVKAMTPWFGRRSRGKVMGFWCTNFQVGPLAATALATFLLVNLGWRASFFVPAIGVAIVGLVILALLVERPEDRGLPPIDTEDEPAPSTPAETAPRRMPFLEVVATPAVWSLSTAYFGVKFIRYSLWFWLPLYLVRVLGYDEGQAGYLSMAFEVGGIVSAIVTGWVSDRFFPGRRALLMAPMLLGLAGAVWLYQVVGGLGWLVNFAAMALVGFLLFGPDALISGAAAQDVGGARGAGSAAGIINGVGSFGAVLQGLVVPKISKAWGWNALFLVFGVMATISACLLLPLAIRRTPPRETPQAD